MKYGDVVRDTTRDAQKESPKRELVAMFIGPSTYSASPINAQSYAEFVVLVNDRGLAIGRCETFTSDGWEMLDDGH